MTEDRIVIETPDGPMEAHRAAPPDGDRGPAVVVLQEAFGVDDHVRSVCRRFAREGYVALAPELYHREGSGRTFGYDDFAAVRPHLAALTNDGIASDIRAALGAVRADRSVDGARVAAVGFCAGGFAAFLAACRTDVAAAVCFYGGGIVRERPGMKLAPLLPEAAGVSCPVLAFFGAEDASIPAADVEAIGARLRALGKTFEIVSYPGAGHGFFNDERSSYRADAAVDAWQRTLDWLERRLAA
ncbi:MAG TPA: dienelactone hydrolase family protein [Thermoanaerobaculia bacterium]|jgi:carboxymethylenebutenolidase|nr:dienelactone hydrolase family protein [Thermoanaerobaculia bacterium]